MLLYPAAIPVSTATLTHLAGLLRAAHRERGTRWRRLDAGEQARLVLAHLRNGDTYQRLAAGFGIGVATVYRYLREAIDLLATHALTLGQAVRGAFTMAWALLDGTLIPIDRIADQRPYYSGKHKRHGINLQVLTSPSGRLLWISPALPGAVHDVKAARTHHIPDTLTRVGVACLADAGYQACGPTIMVPFRRGPKPLSDNQRQVNTSHAGNRAPVERAMATIKTWKIQTKLRCCPDRATNIARAILVLETKPNQP